ncbi:MAG TPA: hypothetical protein QF650_12920 [Vicinamibacterales bacterium]|jgi:hypothetical protein|nr:hypothetical protein [Vicinamibacterales bacterium]|tara:strand:+ start:6262 stop:7614 length:1353 start_codon:yes stop_codon:yes gene_type:complete
MYTISPASVWLAVAVAALLVWAGRGLTPRERRWAWGLVGLALAVRVMAIVVFFLQTDQDAPLFAALIPDGQSFKLRSLWIRSELLGIPLHPDNTARAFMGYGETGYLYLFAAFQIALGPMPYGIHLLNTTFFITGAIILYRTARPAFGGVPALAGLAVILFLPSLFTWSISALKEPLFFLSTALCLASAVAACRTRAWLHRTVAIAICVGAISMAASLRQPGLFILGGGLMAGLTMRFATWNTRQFVACTVLFLLAGTYAVANPAIRERVMDRLRLSASSHYGYVNTPGNTYKLLDSRFYAYQPHEVQALVLNMTPSEAARFLFRAATSFVSTPLPWNATSPSAVAYIPQQMFWYLLVGLALIGGYVGFWRDPLFTCILLGVIVAGAGAVTLNTGNVGTLIRFRDMVVPLVVWLSGLGGCTVIERLARAEGSQLGLENVAPKGHQTYAAG